ncbi:hypothetical protein EDD15DRAFT_2196112 [Pisolithus albus]|nr:hypothetical protein EDD15DRAFT_2196112 [Pisolithus albus]
MSEAGSCLAMLCGGCCKSSIPSQLFSRVNRPPKISKWFVIVTTSSHGWCGCCCKDAFDEEEHFERQMQKEMERTRDKSKYTLVPPVETEPEATEGMSRGSSTAHPPHDVPPTTGNLA